MRRRSIILLLVLVMTVVVALGTGGSALAIQTPFSPEFWIGETVWTSTAWNDTTSGWTTYDFFMVVGNHGTDILPYTLYVQKLMAGTWYNFKTYSLVTATIDIEYEYTYAGIYRYKAVRSSAYDDFAWTGSAWVNY
ncbi:MAG: hypothetical protein JXA87_07785 [Thermoleophilia bacterium]|nr:hypothetical protein [Thermoleophilia bacterium]